MSDFNQIPTKVKFRMIQLKVGQTVSGRCFGPVFTVPFYAVKRKEPRRLTGINRDATVEIFGIQGRTWVYCRHICINKMFKLCSHSPGLFTVNQDDSC